MSLAWNTEQLVNAAAGKTVPARTAVEYHFLSWRELYDKSIISADRHHSSAGEWVLYGDRQFYTVMVTSRPVYALPQHLCLSFDCFSQTNTKSDWTISGPPIDKVAVELITLLSVFSREPLLPLGVRRLDDRPVTIPYDYSQPRRITGTTPPASGIESREFAAIIKGFAQSPNGTRDAIVAAARFYYAALSSTSFDPAGAYVSLVCAIECLAGHHYGDKKFNFDDVKKFEPLKSTLDRIANLPDGKLLAEKMKEELIESEYFLFQKFKSFTAEHLPRSFWSVPDELYPHNSIFPPIPEQKLGSCLRKVYDARSSYVHAGDPFPAYIEFGLRDRVSVEVGASIQNILGKQGYLPPLAWFERLVQLVITEYLRRSCAPELVHARDAEFAEKERLFEVIKGLPPNATKALEKLVRWTAPCLGVAVINPLAPNREWADKAKTVALLMEKGLIGGEGKGLKGSSWLKSRFVGEVVGEHFFGTAQNPFRDNELLLPNR